MLESLKEELVALHLELPRNRLTVWTGGNLSGRDTATGLVVIKPSGIRYEDLRRDHMVVVDLDGRTIEGDLRPSSDVHTHLYIYRHRGDVGGVAHTHSAYATAFAAVRQPIPVVLTAIADEFGGPIPCGGFAPIGDESIGRIVVEGIGTSPAILPAPATASTLMPSSGPRSWPPCSSPCEAPPSSTTARRSACRTGRSPAA